MRVAAVIVVVDVVVIIIIIIITITIIIIITITYHEVAVVSILVPAVLHHHVRVHVQASNGTSLHTFEIMCKRQMVHACMQLSACASVKWYTFECV